MGVVFEIFVLLLVIGGIALFIGPRIMGRRGQRGPGVPGAPGGPGGMADFGGRRGPGGGGQNTSGTLLVTGVSAGAESGGSQFVTITGVINGPTVREHEVYARMQMAVGTAPTMGQLMPVVYSTKNPDKWGIVATPPPAPPYEPPHEPWPPPAPNGPTELR